jgi:Flp pilus assembly CpaE family ATPase
MMVSARIRRGRDGRPSRAAKLSDDAWLGDGAPVIRLERIRIEDGPGEDGEAGQGNKTTATEALSTRASADRVDGVALRRRPGIAVAVADLPFHQEVLDALERDARIDVAGAATDPVRAAELVAHGAPDALVVCPALAEALRHPTTRLRLPRVLVVAQEMTVPVLREAIEIGAHAVYSWPDEREELLDGAASAPTAEPERGGRRAKVIAVIGARGGAGATFVSSNLAAVLTDRGLRVVLADLDHVFGELALALGIARQERWRTIADLLPVAEELSPQHVEDALVAHPRGFRALLAARPGTPPPPAALYAASVALLAGSLDVIVLHVPRWSEDLRRTAVNLADQVVVVTTADVFSLYGVRTLLAGLDRSTRGERCTLVVNRARRRRVGDEAFTAVAGASPDAVIRTDRAAPVRQDRGELLSPRSRRAGRDVRRLAALLVAEPAPGSGR